MLITICSRGSKQSVNTQITAERRALRETVMTRINCGCKLRREVKKERREEHKTEKRRRRGGKEEV